MFYSALGTGKFSRVDEQVSMGTVEVGNYEVASTGSPTQGRCDRQEDGWSSLQFDSDGDYPTEKQSRFRAPLERFLQPRNIFARQADCKLQEQRCNMSLLTTFNNFTYVC